MSYSWSQTDLNVKLSFRVPLSTKQSDLKVEITRDTLVAGLNGVVPVCQVCFLFLLLSLFILCF